MPRHFDDLVLNRIELMKGLHRTVISGLIGGLAGSFLGAAAFVAVDALMPSTAEAQWHCAGASVQPHADMSCCTVPTRHGAPQQRGRALPREPQCAAAR